MTDVEFLIAVRAYCHITGGSITSYGRTVKHNGEVGGVTFSAHLVWLAADIVYDSAAGAEKRDGWARRLGLKLIHEGDHDHAQPEGWAQG